MRPTEVLEREHRETELLLDRLVEAAFSASHHGSPDAILIHRVFRALSIHLGRWHRQKEEDLFFPLIQERGIAREIICGALVQEAHDSLGEGLRALGQLIERARRNPGLWPTVSFRAVDLASAAREHMRNEEEIVFPLAEASLRDSDRAALLAAFREVERLDPHPGAREEIQRLVAGRFSGGGVPAGVGPGARRAGTSNGGTQVPVRSFSSAATPAA
jgi:hemerythrin-like domain-containing protein